MDLIRHQLYKIKIVLSSRSSSYSAGESIRQSPCTTSESYGKNIQKKFDLWFGSIKRMFASRIKKFGELACDNDYFLNQQHDFEK